MSEEKYVYMFEEGNVEMKELLGGKGANLAEMTANGFPVPYGFTITTEVCSHYYANEKTYPADLDPQMLAAVTKMEEKTGKKFGDPSNPLLVSVRSGAPVSMPGMMDTVLNLGLNDEVVEGLVAKTGNDRFVWDSYRRFITMFGDVVMGVKHSSFEKILEGVKETNNIKEDTEMTTEILKDLVGKQKALYKEETGEEFPIDAIEQLKRARDAVFGSWNIDRAISYRRINHIPAHWGTAVNVQEMVFGNMGETSGTGVAFTRDPATGENIFYGEFLMNAQGEDVVAGIRTPLPIAELANVMPHAHEELVAVRAKLETHYKEMQDFEFTIEDKKLYILQTRTGKRTGKAAVKIAVDMVGEKLITKEEGVLRVDPNALDQLLHKQFDPAATYTALTKALPASPGAAVGEAVFTAEHAKMEAEEGKSVILVRVETSPEDIEGMHSAQGILTARGGMTSHAAVVARGMGKCCVAGAESITVDEEAKQFTVGDTVVKEGDIVSLNGTTGEVIAGEVPTVEPSMDEEFATLMGWADEFRTMKVRTNADTPSDAKLARDFGAEGIGLIRTEHMFFDAERIKAVREMILSKDLAGRKVALAKIEPFQIADFEGIFDAMDDLPVIIRMLDPPLHEFLPKEDKEIDEIATELGVESAKIKETIETLHEFNPMLGFRGCRLALVYPEIMEMQVRAILTAAKNSRAKGKTVIPEIEVPLVGNIKEFTELKALVKRVAAEVGAEEGSYSVGTMFEVPRAALTANEFAKEADFISFGTNDLTQMACGFSRDDAGKFLGPYVDMGIYARDPFQAIDQEGVGKLMEMAVKAAREVNPDIDIGICGEHGGEPTSVEFCHRIGLSNVSCSPYRVPIARLAAAQAALRETSK
ncbi:MAG: pyruvate, phosphate dikinase [Candidatus Diapherotrites archaeon]|uniref:pyruvate, phosphate dikinase n=1 Tax=Candidatus Iainarchaeum sp. TaxID=3101447 RepID=A0A8T5GG90_9ARCH|nr:pyruvate, phosphate dikinase [Candidatus Diapherotrites archaeon]